MLLLPAQHVVLRLTEVRTDLVLTHEVEVLANREVVVDFGDQEE